MDAIPARLVAALADRYRIEREVGAGGAATVYLADDLKHDRRVAIKVLRPEVAEALGPSRFEDEIRIAARLQHPHILPVHDSGEADGFLYYVMPYVEGHSLRERLQDGSPRMTPSQVARVLAEVADALAFAHGAGIVHRDIKPENIMLAGKHALVTDFGIAKAISDAGGRKSSTSMGLALGTPAYMAPEQCTADPNLDHRADLYALGIVGYEMLAGHPPFGGSAQEILAAHTVKTPEPLASLRPDIPPVLERVVTRALAKAPADRWQDAEQMQAQLEPLVGSSSSGLTPTIALPVALQRMSPRLRWTIGGAIAIALIAVAIGWAYRRGPEKTVVAESGAAAPTAVQEATAPGASEGIPDLAKDPSIAVLPFENMSSDKEQEYFSDGIAEELLNLLARVPKLRVIARTSSFAYKGKEVGVGQIARELHVASVLEGSVRRSGDKVRITVQLIRASDGTHLWSETYDRTLDDIFKVQDEIAATVVGKLRGTLLAGAPAPAARAVDSRVYAQILRAQALLNTGSKASRTDAVALLESAVKIAPEEPRAWIVLSRGYLNQAASQDGDVTALYAKARAAVDKGLALDPTSAPGMTYRGRLDVVQERGLQQAADSYAKALELEPNNFQVIANASVMLSALGRLGEAADIRRWLSEHDPANPIMQGNYCKSLGSVRRWAEAVEACRAALVLSPDGSYLHSYLSDALARTGKVDAALREAALEPDPVDQALARASVYSAIGKPAEARAELAKVQGNPDYVIEVAAVLADLGDADGAFAQIAKAKPGDQANLKSMLLGSSLDKLHDDPRYVALRRKLEIDPETLGKIRFEMRVPDTL